MLPRGPATALLCWETSISWPGRQRQGLLEHFLCGERRHTVREGLGSHRRKLWDVGGGTPTASLPPHLYSDFSYSGQCDLQGAQPSDASRALTRPSLPLHVRTEDPPAASSLPPRTVPVAPALCFDHSFYFGTFNRLFYLFNMFQGDIFVSKALPIFNYFPRKM